MSNSSSISHFLLLALADTRQLQLLHFCLLLGISLAALLGNGLIISAVACGHHLHTPMFFFLLNLALSDLGSICTTVPKAMHNSLWDTRTISYKGCAAQVFLFVFFISAEFILLIVMSFDRYVAICQPLLYAAIMKPQLCVYLVVAAWVLGFALQSYRLLFLSEPSFCGSKIPHFLCDNSPLFKLSCSDTSLLWKIDSVFLSCVLLGSLCLTLAFYICILLCVLHLPAASGRKKALTMCSSHLLTLSIAYGSCIALYTCPAEAVSLSTSRIVALLNTVLYPLLNPFIYSLRNKSVILALSKSMARARTKLFP
ncbi:unnamed protein product [Coccothraustes coccothraustes]